MSFYTGTSISVKQIRSGRIVWSRVMCSKKIFLRNISKLHSIGLVLNYTPSPPQIMKILTGYLAQIRESSIEVFYLSVIGISIFLGIEAKQIIAYKKGKKSFHNKNWSQQQFSLLGLGSSSLVLEFSVFQLSYFQKVGEKHGFFFYPLRTLGRNSANKFDALRYGTCSPIGVYVLGTHFLDRLILCGDFGCFLGENSWSWFRSRTLHFESKCLSHCKSSILCFHKISAYLPSFP